MLEAVLLKRFRKCYHKSMSAAYLCDPALHTFDDDSNTFGAAAKQISDIEAHLRIDIWMDARQVGARQISLQK